MLFDLTGKRCLVTGGVRGIGAWMARGLAEAGASVVVTGRSEHDCLAIEQKAAERGLNVSAIVADLSSAKAAETFGLAFAETGPLHALFNNAGANSYVGLESPSDWSVMGVNVEAVFELSRVLLPQLREAAKPNDPGRIIVVSSIDGIRPSDLNSFSYGASKAASLHVAKHLAKMVGRTGVSVNTIAPGPFRTRMMVETLPQLRRTLGVSGPMDSLTPMGRLGGYEDIGGVAVFLAARASAYMNGATLVVDGGLIADV